jgi:hypothetical protein
VPDFLLTLTDGKADAIFVGVHGVSVLLSDGTKFLKRKLWTLNPYSGDVGSYFADVRGVGRADAIVVNASGVTVRYSDGTKFSLPNQPWTTNPYFGDLQPICFE